VRGETRRKRKGDSRPNCRRPESASASAAGSVLAWVWARELVSGKASETASGWATEWAKALGSAKGSASDVASATVSG
jgi:hypothetical protein